MSNRQPGFGAVRSNAARRAAALNPGRRGRPPGSQNTVPRPRQEPDPPPQGYVVIDRWAGGRLDRPGTVVSSHATRAQATQARDALEPFASGPCDPWDQRGQRQYRYVVNLAGQLPSGTGSGIVPPADSETPA